jgi:dienelactone hydrolase
MEKITFGVDNLPGYIVGDVNNPAMLVIQEWWGVNDVCFYGFLRKIFEILFSN